MTVISRPATSPGPMAPRLAKSLASLFFGIGCAAGIASAAMAQDNPVRVGTIELRSEEVARQITLPGRAIAWQEANVRPRVTGIVTEILYVPGRQIETGAPMFRLDSDSYQARVVSAQAALAQAEARLPVARSAAQRARALEGLGTARVGVEAAEAAEKTAEAEVGSAGAALRIAEQELSWTEIRAPIGGIPGFAAVSVGDLVTSGQSDALTRILRLDPIYVDLAEPAARALSIRSLVEGGQLRRNAELNVTLTLENGERHSSLGRLVAPAAEVSTSTGSQDIRFEFDNPDRRILPGMFLRGDVEIGQMTAFRIPQRAAEVGRNGVLEVWTVGADNKSERKTLVQAGSDGNDWLVTSGLDEGTLLMVDGTSNMRPGREVIPVPVRIDELGVVRDLGPADPAPQAGN